MERELLRFLTVGSVDDGKSTLIGRLLHDTASIYEDQFQSLQSASTRMAGGLGSGIDFSLVTDGLRAEREQGITIDVAYRAFSTPRRRFIIADTPGHEQYTRNMATGASTASVAVLLIDARMGMLPQTRRHAIIAWLFGIRDLAVCVNKMDLVQFDHGRFCAIQRDFSEFLAKLGDVRAHFVPICAIDGDNVVQRSPRTPWFAGQVLLDYLETVCPEARTGREEMRFPVQYVIRAAGESRRYAGQLSSGVLRKGDEVRVVPSGQPTRISSIRIGDREIDTAVSPQCLSVALESDLDVGRGNLIAGAADLPIVSSRI